MGMTKEKKLFELGNQDVVVDAEGFYWGHKHLLRLYRNHKKDFSEYFSVLDKLDSNKENLECVQRLFFEEFNNKHNQAQCSLAQTYLERKIVKVSNGIPEANAEPDNFSVYWVDKPSWFTLSQNPDILVELAYGSDSLGRILITRETKIKIIGDLNDSEKD